MPLATCNAGQTVNQTKFPGQTNISFNSSRIKVKAINLIKDSTSLIVDGGLKRRRLIDRWFII